MCDFTEDISTCERVVQGDEARAMPTNSERRTPQRRTQKVGGCLVRPPVAGSSVYERDERRAEMAAWVVVEGGDQVVSAEHLLDTRTLHADAAAMHETHVAEAVAPGFLEIGIDDIGDVAWCERMQVELGPDRNDVRVIHGMWNAEHRNADRRRG